MITVVVATDVQLLLFVIYNTGHQHFISHLVVLYGLWDNFGDKAHTRFDLVPSDRHRAYAALGGQWF